MIKMKLKIDGTNKKEEITKTKDPFEDLTDSELEAIQDEIFDDDEKKIAELKQAIIDDDETEDVIKATECVSITDELGIKLKYIESFEKLFPNKKITYNNLITKQFLEWYIKTCIFSDLSTFNSDSQLINPTQQIAIVKLVANRVKEDNTTEVEEINIEMNTEQDLLMYEFILSEKWNVDNRAKGISELDAILEEQMRVKKMNIHQALSNVMKTFELETKFSLSQSSNVVQEPEKKKETMSSPEISKAIKYFKHIEFLYKLMSDDEKMKFVEDYIPTDEELKTLEKIKDVLTARSIRKEVVPKAEVANSILDKMLSGGLE